MNEAINDRTTQQIVFYLKEGKLIIFNSMVKTRGQCANRNKPERGLMRTGFLYICKIKVKKKIQTHQLRTQRGEICYQPGPKKWRMTLVQGYYTKVKVNFSHCCDQKSNTRNLKEEGFLLVHYPWDTAYHSMEGGVWPHYIHSLKAVQGARWSSALFSLHFSVWDSRP